VARPGLEPGTPRFSVVGQKSSNTAESPAFWRFAGRRDQEPDRRKLPSFVADLGTRMGFSAQCAGHDPAADEGAPLGFPPPPESARPCGHHVGVMQHGWALRPTVSECSSLATGTPESVVVRGTGALSLMSACRVVKGERSAARRGRRTGWAARRPLKGRPAACSIETADHVLAMGVERAVSPAAGLPNTSVHAGWLGAPAATMS
jgi:hypothetical protein